MEEVRKSYRLIDILDTLIDYRGKTPRKTTFGIPLITAKIIKNGRIETPTEFIAFEDYDSWMVRGFPKIGDVVLTTEAPLGEVAQLDNEHVALAQRVVTLRGKSGVLNNTYLKYYLLSNVGQQRLKARETGTTVTGIKQSELREVLVDCPPYAIQERIAFILKSLDDKIECNKRINDNLSWTLWMEHMVLLLLKLKNDNLEQQARTMFNSWKNSVKGNAHTSIRLDSIASFISGYSYKGAELAPSKKAMATIKNFSRNGGFKMDGYKEIEPSNKIKPEQYADMFDVLVAHTDITQNADVIGNAEMILSLGGYESIIFSMDLVKVVPKPAFPYRFFLATILRDSDFKSHCMGYVNGTTVLHMNKKALPNYTLALPDDMNNVIRIDNCLSMVYKKIAEILSENTRLSQLRDTLLPRLMSGELKVNELK